VYRSSVERCALSLAFAAAVACGKDAQPANRDSAVAPAAASAAVPAAAVQRSEVPDTSTAEVPVGRVGAIELFPAGTLSAIADRLSRGSTTAKTVVAHPTFHYVEARRSANGVPEVHDRWIDVTIVQAGRANLLVGGRVTGSSLASPGEHRGGTITGGATKPIAAGDLFTIPAGVPHQYLVAPGDSIRYLTIKVIQPAG
jgi:mannose-6-phosphate isomerase-like protein (cupin superfamily)